MLSTLKSNLKNLESLSQEKGEQLENLKKKIDECRREISSLNRAKGQVEELLSEKTKRIGVLKDKISSIKENLEEF